MSVRRLAPDHVQAFAFAFTAANENWILGQIAKYPTGRQASAVIPLLWKGQAMLASAGLTPTPTFPLSERRGDDVPDAVFGEVDR